MTPGGRLAAAVEVFADIEARHRPAADALKDYGLSHRFAGSKDRAAIAALVYDALRCRASSAWIMGAETPRGIVLGAVTQVGGIGVEALAAICGGSAHAPEPLSEGERAALASPLLDNAPFHVQGDFPPWLERELSLVFGDDLISEMRALAQRAPLDVRINTLKASREQVLAALDHLGPVPGGYAPDALRLPLGTDGRGPALSGEPAFLKGMIEVQDEGSQLAVLLAMPPPGGQVLDLCAGGGGKTLALAAAMGNRGQIYATDADLRRLAALRPRLERSGARNVQIRSPRRGVPPLDDLIARCDLVLVDAPCTGTGTWRRNPDAKWRVRPGALEIRIREQDTVLAEAARYVKPGGRIAYVTCSLLAAENEARVERFREIHSDFAVLSPKTVASAANLPALAAHIDNQDFGIRLSPLRTATDGFFIATLIRS